MGCWGESSLNLKQCAWRILALVGFVLLMASCAGVALQPDEAMAQLGIRDAQQAGDATVIIEGCGNQPLVGWTYCRFNEQAVASGQVSLIVPPAQCRPEGGSCVDWLIIRPDGTEFGGAVPRGQTRVNIPLRQIVNDERVGRGARGPYGVLLTVKWVDEQGHDRESRAEGEIYFRVLANGYRRMDATPTSRSYVWNWSEGNRVYRMTTALRAYTGAQ